MTPSSCSECFLPFSRFLPDPPWSCGRCPWPSDLPSALASFSSSVGLVLGDGSWFRGLGFRGLGVYGFMGLGFRFPQEQARAAGTSRTCADPLVFHARPEVLSETSLETWRVGGLSKCFFLQTCTSHNPN